MEKCERASQNDWENGCQADEWKIRYGMIIYFGNVHDTQISIVWKTECNALHVAHVKGEELGM